MKHSVKMLTSKAKLYKWYALFLGGHGGIGVESNGEGGFSYYNPEAVLLLLDSGLEFAPSSLNSREKRLAKLWKSSGPGFVHILPQMSDHTCQVSRI